MLNQEYLDGDALVMSVVAVNQAALHFRNDLPYYIAAHPDPYVPERVFTCEFYLELLELLHLLGLIPVGQVEEHHSQHNHYPIYHYFPNF